MITGTIQSACIDNGLAYIHANADKLFIVSAEPQTYTDAVSTFALGVFNFGIGLAAGAPGPGTPNGRQVTVGAVTTGNVTANGTAVGWALVHSAGSELLVDGALSAPQMVITNNSWNSPAFGIRIPSQ